MTLHYRREIDAFLRFAIELVSIVTILGLAAVILIGPAELPVREPHALGLTTYEHRWPDAHYLAHTADSARVPREVLFALTYQETRFNVNPKVRGKAHEIGRTQIKAATAAYHCPGLDVRKYKDNIACAVKMLARDGTTADWRTAISRHNGGSEQYVREVLTTIGELEVRP